MTMSQLEDYVKTIEALKKEYREDITIFLALEMEYFRGFLSRQLKKLDSIQWIICFWHSIFSMKMKVLSV